MGGSRSSVAHRRALARVFLPTLRAVFDAPRALYQAQLVQKANYRGYVPLAFFTPNAGGTQADRYEAWKLHWEADPADTVCAASALYGPNR